MKERFFIRSLLLLGFILLVGSGCSMSYSIDQSSDSITQSSDSISGSFESFTSISTSSGGGQKSVQEALQRFRDDVKGLTRVFLNGSDGSDNFERELSTVAMHYGILDWEREPMTFEAIGKGLRDGGLAEDEIQRVSFLQTPVLKQNSNHIMEGFQEV
jgi:hypothetical protein